MKPESKPYRKWLLGLLAWFQVLVFAQPASADTTKPACFSCQIEIKSLVRPTNLQGLWLFTRDDAPTNAKPGLDTSEWVTVPTPGAWNAAYRDGKNFTVGWYRGEFHFAPSLIGKEAVFFVDAYMSRLQVFQDGTRIFHRHGRDSFQKYFSIQPVPVRFKITQPHHVISFRIETMLMTGDGQVRPLHGGW
ncbi:MAG: hypothetical protein M3Q07_11750 [Pseudobdellovibrionaceae bacterium]|nr:hypothetical protein [Pseudobdellovibrionaceae bacterium]